VPAARAIIRPLAHVKALVIRADVSIAVAFLNNTLGGRQARNPP
jgi:hypothetical protein